MKDNDNECDDGATAVVEWPGEPLRSGYSRCRWVEVGVWMICRCQWREVDGCRIPRWHCGRVDWKGAKWWWWTEDKIGATGLKIKLDTSVKNKAREQATEKKNNSKNKVYTIKKKATKRKAKCNDDRDGGKNDAMMSCV